MELIPLCTAPAAALEAAANSCRDGIGENVGDQRRGNLLHRGEPKPIILQGRGALTLADLHLAHRLNLPEFLIEIVVEFQACRATGCSPASAPG